MRPLEAVAGDVEAGRLQIGRGGLFVPGVSQMLGPPGRIAAGVPCGGAAVRR